MDVFQQMTSEQRMALMPPQLNGTNSYIYQLMDIDVNCAMYGDDFSKTLEVKINRHDETKGILKHDTFVTPDGEAKHILIGDHFFVRMMERIFDQKYAGLSAAEKETKLDNAMAAFKRILNLPNYWKRVKDYYVSCKDGEMVADTGYTGFAVVDNESDFVFLVGCGENWMVLISCLNKQTPNLAIFHDLVPITVRSTGRNFVGWEAHNNIFNKNSRDAVDLVRQNSKKRR